ncbi:hypothetical protein [Mangrovimonas sp. YM274]|uniref:hypothetical protein n=1 Tax=Mangrovimonas sp. YM274 TaxID=3070660 RepID=UPI0027DD8D12|nr:hypothetical protein [Mangrovimonas sp. YM274]WMI69404.1 hypothetical protein RBH95_03315 [Mangrovimonas sp. YM274]
MKPLEWGIGKFYNHIFVIINTKEKPTKTSIGFNLALGSSPRFIRSAEIPNTNTKDRNEMMSFELPSEKLEGDTTSILNITTPKISFFSVEEEALVSFIIRE